MVGGPLVWFVKLTETGNVQLLFTEVIKSGKTLPVSMIALSTFFTCAFPEHPKLFFTASTIGKLPAEEYKWLGLISVVLRFPSPKSQIKLVMVPPGPAVEVFVKLIV